MDPDEIERLWERIDNDEEYIEDLEGENKSLKRQIEELKEDNHRCSQELQQAYKIIRALNRTLAERSDY